MAVQPIRQLGDPLLRTLSAPVDPRQARFADLRDTLHQFQRDHGFGRGISAVQIGRAERLIYLEIDGRSYELINPEYISRSEEKFELWDDCFSFPHLLVHLSRSTHCRLRYQLPDGTWQELEAAGAFSELLQHEMDHLDGILAVDHGAPVPRESLERMRSACAAIAAVEPWVSIDDEHPFALDTDSGHRWYCCVFASTFQGHRNFAFYDDVQHDRAPATPQDSFTIHFNDQPEAIIQRPGEVLRAPNAEELAEINDCLLASLLFFEWLAENDDADPWANPDTLPLLANWAEQLDVLQIRRDGNR